VKSLLKNPKRPTHQLEAVNLDVTPVMNMFVILIPFLVSMAVFAQLSVLKFSLPSNAGAEQGGPQKKDLKLTVVMSPEAFLLTIGEMLVDSIPSTEEGLDFDRLSQALAENRETLTRKEEVVLAVDDKINFDNIVQTMDVCRNGGFSKIALSEKAAGNEEVQK